MIVAAAGIATHQLTGNRAWEGVASIVIGCGLGFVVGFALMNLAWSPGQLLGSVFGGGIAQLSSDALPYAVAAFLCVAALRWT